MRRQFWWVGLIAAFMSGCLTTSSTEDRGGAIGIQWDDPTAGPTGRWQGQKEFVSAGPWSHIWRPWLRTLSAEASPQAAEAKRVIEESDIFKVLGDTLFVLNPYRGLVTIDIMNPDRPEIVGRTPIIGSPKDMVVRGDRAYVLMNDWYDWNRGQEQFHGSQVLVVDVSDVTEPVVTGKFPVAGTVEDSRLVGDVLYVVSSSWGWENGQDQSATHVLSIDVANPSAIAEVDRESFPGSGHLINVTEDFIFVAAYDWENQGTKIQAVNIMDPAGDMFIGGSVQLDGYVQDRFMMDFTGDHLRVVTHEWEDQGTVTVWTLVADRSARTLKFDGRLELGNVGQLTAARFSDDRAYLVHVQRVDPLDVVDLSNPTSPVRLSSLVIPGWLEHIEVHGDRVLGIGFDQAGTPAPERLCEGNTYEPLAAGRMLSAAIYDVSDPGATCEGARVRFGEGQWAWSNAFYDDKALRFLPDAHLLLLPFGSWTENQSVNATQMIDVDLPAMRLAVDGRVESLSQIDRSFVDHDRLMAFGDRELLVADIRDRANPAVTARLELTRNVTAFSPVGDMGAAVQLVGDWNEDAELRVVEIEHPDAENTEVLGRVSVGAPAGDLFVNGSIATVVSRKYTEQGSNVRLATFDISDPWNPRQRGAIELPAGYGGGFPYMQYASVQDVVRVQATTFVVAATTEEGMKFSVVSTKNPSNPRVLREHVRPNDKTTIFDLRVYWNKLYVVSYTPVEDAAAEPLQGEFGVETDVAGPAAPAGTADALTARIMPPWRPVQEKVRWSVTRVSFSSNGNPTIGNTVNVPGRLVDVSRDGKIWTLLDNRWQAAPEYRTCGGIMAPNCGEGFECQEDPRDSCDPQNGGADCGGICVPTGTLPSFDATQTKAIFTARVAATPTVATLLDGIGVAQGVEDVKVRGNAAYYTVYDSWMGPIVPLAATAANADTAVAPEPQEPQFRMAVLNFADPTRISEASSVAVEQNGSSGNLLDVREVSHQRYAILGMGWGGVAVYDVTDMHAPELDQFVRSNAYYSSVVISRNEHAAYLAGGYYGVLEIRLSPNAQ